MTQVILFNHDSMVIDDVTWNVTQSSWVEQSSNVDRFFSCGGLDCGVTFSGVRDCVEFVFRVNTGGMFVWNLLERIDLSSYCNWMMKKRKSEVLRRSDIDDDDGSCLKSHVRAMNNLPTPQARKKTLSLIDEKDFDRLKEFSDREEDFQ